MGKAKAKAKPKPTKQTSLATAGFYPMLPKPATALGKFTSNPGKYWEGCPAADKEKRYKCTVIDFIALHDFGNGIKGAGFKCKEMGEDGRGCSRARAL